MAIRTQVLWACKTNGDSFFNWLDFIHFFYSGGVVTASNFCKCASPSKLILSPRSCSLCSASRNKRVPLFLTGVKINILFSYQFSIANWEANDLRALIMVCWGWLILQLWLIFTLLCQFPVFQGIMCILKFLQKWHSVLMESQVVWT